LTLTDGPLADVQAQTICHPPDPVRDRPLRRSARKNDPKAAGTLPTAEAQACQMKDGSVRTLLLVAALLAVPALGRSDDAPSSTDLTSIGLEDLMQLEVTSVSRREEPLFRAASAITVLTADDIERSGATNIPDLLRRVPGMNVAQINSNTWAVSARGFNGQYANKMLVLVDGRTVYDPVFSGVYWDALDVLMEDVERIEVIRGPGATAWGANAVNGVINIITRSAKASPGTLAIAGGGSHPNGFGGFRYAGAVGPNTDFRVSAKYQHVSRFSELAGPIGHDALGLTHVGGSLDWHRSSRDEITFQGDVYDGTVEQRSSLVTLDPPYSIVVDAYHHVRGANLMGSWQHTFSPFSDFKLTAYFDRSARPGTLISQKLKTFDIDLQHRLALRDRHDFMWGGGYRVVDLEIDGSTTAWFDPTHRTTGLANVFVQDAIAVVRRRVTLTLGSKFEHNDFSGLEVEPSARLLWSASPSQTVWSAVSRAVRTPGPADEDVAFNQNAFPIGGGAVGVARIIGADLRSEILTSVEVGYRTQIHPRLSLDLTTFENRYSRLRAADVGPPFPEADPAPAHMVFPLYFTNGFSARARGLEGTLTWQPRARFGSTVSHSLFWMRLDRSEGTTARADIAVGDAPTYQLVVQPHIVLARHLRLDAAWYHVDDLPAQRVPAYDRLDARLGWAPGSGLEFSAGVQNVFHDGTLEFNNVQGTSAATTVGTGAYGKVVWKL
jgi:iron complex outermembrane receptor protein